ncbi:MULTISPECIES: aldehyde dehydrogenase family protein [unclassified Rhizobium]|uniref:aldehyde dehydrogenase family protein n=1 Tax=unclassified Rhizobium TaxID=2613769 RepID=UPI0006FE2C58|nr:MULTISPECIES: aldehyde dehydrogenase family protein [unclassified Rhizobium]KQV39388.1 aldehyde dehydrogenase [Rhizobium sp. Root1212]KRD35393.1 aldehyde dehydrogenase [Rhizobium sp. Root268]
MDNYGKFYIDGEWREPSSGEYLDVVDPSTEKPFAKIALGAPKDVDDAVATARRAFPAYSQVSVADRIAFFKRVLDIFRRRQNEIAEIVTKEMGSPITFSIEAQTATCVAHIEAIIDILQDFSFEERSGTTLIVKEPIGVVGLITPWNWPINQVVCKVLPALAAGCTIVIKPSEIAPLDATIFTEILEEAGLPAGVFNLVNGEGPVVGEAISAHPDIDMVSFTGSTRAGVRVAKAAADTVKRVTQELGGKSANILLDDVDFASAVRNGIVGCFANSGQSCDAPTRMLVPKSRYDEVLAIARDAAGDQTVGDPTDPATVLGPLASEVHFNKVQGLIRQGIDEGATVLVGGPGRPEGLDIGYYVKPTIFANVTNDMKIAQEEIFGPVLCILPYEDEQDAIRIANDTPYGLAAYVQSADQDRARRVARQLRAGSIFINYPDWDPLAPFGGYKQSGNGREAGHHSLSEYLEIKAMVGHG